jgi:NodT family efflux transporter outer membrane factor (OMF) lipoprotein
MTSRIFLPSGISLACALSLAAPLMLLQACASLPDATPNSVGSLPSEWQTPPDHLQAAAAASGAQAPAPSSSSSGTQWWSQFDDPLLSKLIEQAVQKNPNLAQAQARITQARAAAQAAGVNLWPKADGRLGSTRSHTDLPPTPGTATLNSASIDATWELDLFGANRHGSAAARERALGSEAAAHAAQIGLAAEVANAYVNLRTCEIMLALYIQDKDSLGQTSELTEKKARAGFDSAANAALADASAADAANRVVSQRAECDIAIKGLVALTLQPEATLREALKERTGQIPQPQAFEVPRVPAQVLTQRPDLQAAQRQVAATASDVGSAEANRWPRLTLMGSIGRSQLRAEGSTFEGNTWSIGPSLLAPLFDAGGRQAAATAARARYDEAQASWQATAVNAVREVEESLVRLDAAEKREADARRAAQGYATFFKAANAQWRAGAGSLLDLEQARRSKLAADAALAQVQRERVSAWLTLYKAIGGGWQS